MGRLQAFYIQAHFFFCHAFCIRFVHNFPERQRTEYKILHCAPIGCVHLGHQGAAFCRHTETDEEVLRKCLSMLLENVLFFAEDREYMFANVGVFVCRHVLLRHLCSNACCLKEHNTVTPMLFVRTSMPFSILC